MMRCFRRNHQVYRITPLESRASNMLLKTSRVEQIGQIHCVSASWVAIFRVEIPAHNRLYGVSANTLDTSSRKVPKHEFSGRYITIIRVVQLVRAFRRVTGSVSEARVSTGYQLESFAEQNPDTSIASSASTRLVNERGVVSAKFRNKVQSSCLRRSTRSQSEQQCQVNILRHSYVRTVICFAEIWH